MLNLLIISGVLVGCASEGSSFDSFYDEPSATTEDLRVPVMLEFPVKVLDGTEGRVEIAPYRYGENGIQIGKVLSAAEIVDGVAMVGIPGSAPKRDLTGQDASPVTYAIVLRGESEDIVGISDARLIFSRVVAPERVIGWNLGFNLGEVNEYFKSIHSNAEISANLRGTNSININVISEVESAEDQHIGIVTYTDALYTIWDAHMQTGLEVFLDGEPPRSSFVTDVDGLTMHQSIGVAYRDSNLDGNFDMDEPVDGLFCRDSSVLNVTYIPEIYEVNEALTMEAHRLRTGWTVTQQGTNGLESFPVDAPLNLTVQSACAIPN